MATPFDERSVDLCVELGIPLLKIASSDLNDWIGRSQWTSDHTFNGTVDEFRIYGKALSECAMRAVYSAGPNSL